MHYESKERQILDQVTAMLHQHYGERLSRVMLFGSRARRDHTPDSDYDLLVVLKGEVDWNSTRAKVSDLIYPIECEHWVVIYCLPKSEDQYLHEQTPIMMNIRREGVEL